MSRQFSEMRGQTMGGTFNGTGSLRPTTTAGGGTTLGRLRTQIQEGNFTATIYTHIRDHQYDEAIDLLEQQLEEFPRSRAAISLLAFCFYHVADYVNAAQMYEQLTKICPGVEEYRVYHAQAVYKAGAYQDAARMCVAIDSPQYAMRVSKLQADIAYEQGEIQQTTALLNECSEEDPDVLVLHGCVLYQEGSYEGALKNFEEAMNALGFKPDLAYNIALTYYRMQKYVQALKHIGDIIERGIQEHPELNIGSNTEGTEARSVGNTPVLQESALVEAFNLKAAIEFFMKNMEAANEALTDMPPRRKEELDPVTLHNKALLNMDEDPSSGLDIFEFLVQHPPFPPDTFQNLLLFYCKYHLYDRAADVLAENPQLTWKYMTNKNHALYDYLDGLITAQTSAAEAYRKFDILSQKHLDQLRKTAKRIQDAKQSSDKAAGAAALKAYDSALEEYIAVLMAQANIYWEIENYPMAERLFRQSAEFCSEDPVWTLNVAHVFFMQEKFPEAIRYYEPVVATNTENILNCSAIVLANLCVAYIMTSMNEKAEEIMRRIEQDEEKLMYGEPEKQPLHLCIVNLVIGTLYCAKGNFEFGISRIIKALEPYGRKIMTDTWFYAKRCFLALAMNLAKHMVILNDGTLNEVITFFDEADRYGENIPAAVQQDPTKSDGIAKNTVRFEARQLKDLFLRLRE